ncbi:Vacuolar protein-sorting-associated protein 36 [Entomortierella chlamydospora]|uniref:Vacuolar protein-sorting-associated protein 36 n=1 Tax=Entomortierella chlamydospora TaxID=101097 RepID=A0A9P6T0T5_9FUNG|nr:Vacuolar protein-sorting-associated protein 36 [Entomortierella chlamydospora]
MSSSPKITLELYPRSHNIDKQPLSDSNTSYGGSASVSELDTNLSSLSLRSNPTWLCAICSASNQGNLTKCAVCGVKRPAGTVETPTTPAADPFLLNEPIRGNESQTTALDQPRIACPACTFHNDPFMIQCEMCGTELQDAQSRAFALHRQEQHQRSIRQLPSTINASSPSPLSNGAPSPAESTVIKSSGNGSFLSSFYSGGSSLKTAEDTNSIKLSFRAGGNGSFHSLLKNVMAAKAWEVIEIVPSGIMRTAETNKKATDETLSQAFQDLKGLMDKAAEMVALAETISNRLAKSNTMNTEDTVIFKTYLLSMGIASPVTKDTAGAVFHKELARELAEFILPIVQREGGTMSLMDVYCVFNRARGVELISPKDLHTACQMFEELKLPLRMRKFDSGLLVIQTMARYSDDEVSNSIASRIRSLPPGDGLTAIELASAIQISVALAQEQLLMTEARGLICRDESVEGLRFYDNLFAKWEI